jgi:hypothetical protein
MTSFIAKLSTLITPSYVLAALTIGGLAYKNHKLNTDIVRYESQIHELKSDLWMSGYDRRAAIRKTHLFHLIDREKAQAFVAQDTDDMRESDSRLIEDANERGYGCSDTYAADRRDNTRSILNNLAQKDDEIEQMLLDLQGIVARAGLARTNQHVAPSK